MKDFFYIEREKELDNSCIVVNNYLWIVLSVDQYTQVTALKYPHNNNYLWIVLRVDQYKIQHSYQIQRNDKL